VNIKFFLNYIFTNTSVSKIKTIDLCCSVIICSVSQNYISVQFDMRDSEYLFFKKINSRLWIGFGAYWITFSLSYRNPANPRASMTDHYRSRSMSHGICVLMEIIHDTCSVLIISARHTVNHENSAVILGQTCVGISMHI